MVLFHLLFDQLRLKAKKTQVRRLEATEASDLCDLTDEPRAIFVDSTDRYQVGTPVPRTKCTFTINGLLKRQGMILTPTYPGTYPKDLSCAYKFVGAKGQRIRIEFRDFDVLYGGAQ